MRCRDGGNSSSEGICEPSALADDPSTDSSVCDCSTVDPCCHECRTQGRDRSLVPHATRTDTSVGGSRSLFSGCARRFPMVCGVPQRERSPAAQGCRDRNIATGAGSASCSVSSTSFAIEPAFSLQLPQQPARTD